MKENGRIVFSQDGIKAIYHTYPYIEPYWIRIKTDKEYSDQKVFHLAPESNVINHIESYLIDLPQTRLVNADAIIVKRNSYPFVIASLLKESASIAVCSDRWVGFLNVGINQISSRDSLIHKFFEQWPDRRMASTTIWIGPTFTECNPKIDTSSQQKIDLRHEIEAQLVEIDKSRPICRVRSTLTQKYDSYNDTNSSKNRCSARLIIEPIPTRP